MKEGTGPFVRLDGVERSFGAVRALRGVDLSCNPGECLGLVGHNGAGKSTLMHILAGTGTLERGSVTVAGTAFPAGYGAALAQRLGIRCVFQELSLCPNLTVAENARVAHAGLKGWGWRQRSGRLITGKLDEIFPGHGIAAGDIVGDLPIGSRQMVEIARAFTVTDIEARLVILDEPTSSLDAMVAGQLLGFLRRFVAQGGACIFISHRLGEILSVSDRIVVMRDGQAVAERPASGFTRDALVAAMGGSSPAAAGGIIAAARREGAPLLRAQNDGGELVAHPGEIVGLAGLAGQGQTRMLRRLFEAASRKDHGASVMAPVALIAGDRQSDGIFPLWSIGKNITVGSLSRMLRGPLIDPKRERAMAEDWRAKVNIRTPDMDNGILSLSGGNQQKALFARALGSDARIVLMDDPTRGVDFATKQEIYALIRAEAEKGRSFIWYTTEMDELSHCDHVYVFRGGRVVADLPRADVSEEKVLHASFEEAA